MHGCRDSAGFSGILTRAVIQVNVTRVQVVGEVNKVARRRAILASQRRLARGPENEILRVLADWAASNRTGSSVTD